MKRFGSYMTVLVAVIISLGLLALFLADARAAQVSETGEVDLSISLKAPQHVVPGETYVANLAYSNLGDIPSPDDTSISLLLPDGVEFVSAVDQAGEDFSPASNSDGLLVWDVGAVAAGDCCKHIFVTLAVQEDRAEGDELVLQAEISSDADETDLTNNTASVTSIVCDMAGSTKQVNAGEVKPGDILTYTIQLRLAERKGSNAIERRQVTLTDTLPAQHQVRFLGWTGEETGTWDGNTLRWQGMVQAGEAVTLQYRLGVEGDTPPGEMITNTAEIEYGAMRLRLGPTASTVEMPPDAVMVGPLGHTWQVRANLGIEIPPGAVQEMTRFEYRWMDGEDPGMAPERYQYAHRFFELNAYQFGEQHQFGEAIRLMLKLKPEEIAGLRRETLRLWYRNDPGEPWQMLGEPTWLSNDTLVFTTDHFTQFALFGKSDFQVFLPVLARR